MLGTIQKLFGNRTPVPENSEDGEQQQYIQYTVEVEQTLCKLEAGLHESDDPHEILQSAMK